MTLYFDTLIQNPDSHAVNSQIAWHSQASCLAVSSFSVEKGATVNVYTGEGKLMTEVDIPPNPSAEVTSLAWHPIQRILAVGYETGELYLWNDHEEELHQIQSLHRASISILQFSVGGSRLVTADKSGSVVGWRSSNSGNLQTAFSHELKDPLTQIVFRSSPQDQFSTPIDINGLARAAVSGDEAALDMFSSWRPRTGHKRATLTTAPPRENVAFYLGSASGAVHHVSEGGAFTEVLTTDGAVLRLLHHSQRGLLVVITDALVLAQYSTAPDGSVTEISKVKLSTGRTQDIQLCWATPGVMAVSTGDSSVRLWNIDTGDNFVLSLKPGLGFRDNETILCLSYCAYKNVLSAGTGYGRLAMWRYEQQTRPPDASLYAPLDPESDWTLQPPTSLAGAITQMSWGSSQSLLAVNTMREVYVLYEQDMATSYADQVCVVQVSPTQLLVQVFSGNHQVKIDVGHQVRGVHSSQDNILVWNQTQMSVFQLSADVTSASKAGSWPCESENGLVHDTFVLSLEGDVINVRSVQGNIKQTLTFPESDGQPVGMDLCGNFLLTYTILGHVKLWDLSGREVKAHSASKNFGDSLKDFGEIMSARVNSEGTKVSVSVAQTSLLPDPKLYIWDLENDNITYFNFASGQAEEDDLDGNAPPNSAESAHSKDASLQDRARRQAAREVCGRFVRNHVWDREDARLLVCEAHHAQPQHSPSASFAALHTGGLGREQGEKPGSVVASLFVSGEHGTIVQDVFPLSPRHTRLIGVQVPHHYLLNAADHDPAAGIVTQRVQRDFAGLEDSDRATREAMLNFSFFLAIGSMDEAFQAIKAIKSQGVWENMGKMCVKTCRLDVASLCLGNMGHARGARALRLAMQEPELDARVAMLALQLGMVDEAEKLYRSCGRYDLLNKLFQDAGLWSKALNVAASNDRIHLRTTHYNYARHLESKGEFSGAVTNYEKSDTHRFEVPRMLFDELPSLEEYIMHTQDKALRRWWAQYLESTGEMETALQFYEAAGDHLSLVRVYCYCNNLQKAADIADRSEDRAACYHLARQYENVNQVKEAIHFFSRAHAYGNAIRICKDNGYDDQLLNLALVASPQEQIEAARYFMACDRPQTSRAVTLYHRAGLLSKAFDLAFKSGQVSVVAQIAEELDDSADPAMVSNCAEYFISNRQYDKAVNLLITGKQYERALELCVEHGVWVTEQLAERFTLPKDEKARHAILEKVAQCAYLQENYKLATKKFTQAGNKVKAMKSLLKSGDTERIVYFANVCRQRDIYVMAANYLQSLDWRKDSEIMRNIINFYTRAKAFVLLSGFYDSCAQVEIDEYQQYDKAGAALVEAHKALTEAVTSGDGDAQARLPPLQYKLEKVRQFLQFKTLLEGDSDSAVQGLYELLNDSSIETAVRQGDIFAAIVEHYAYNNNYKSALGTLQEMKNRLPKVNPSYFVSGEALDAIAEATGATFTPSNRRTGGRGGEEEDENGEADSEEEVPEEEEEEEERPHFNNRLMNGAVKFL